MAVEGLDRLLRKMALIPPRVEKAAAQALEKSAEEMVQMMRRHVGKKSGTLAASIGWTWGEAPAGSMVIGQFKGHAKASMAITIYAGGKVGDDDAFYGRFQEFGTRHMAANPFFYPAYRALKPRHISRLKREVRKAMKQA